MGRIMKLRIENEYNPVDKTPKTWILKLEELEPICKICSNKLEEYCYFNKKFKVFNCLDCVRDGMLYDKKTGSKIPLIMDTYSGNCLTVKLVR